MRTFANLSSPKTIGRDGEDRPQQEEGLVGGVGGGGTGPVEQRGHHGLLLKPMGVRSRDLSAGAVNRPAPHDCGRRSMRTQHRPGAGCSRAVRPVPGTPSRTPSSRRRFMPQTSSVCSCARAWNGQLASVMAPSSTLGSNPWSSRPGARPARRPRVAAARQFPATLPGPPLEGRAGLLPRPLRVRHRVGQQASREVVAPLGQGDRDRALATPVELGGAAGARSGAAGPPLVAGVEQALLDQAVQMERRGRRAAGPGPRRPRRGSPAATVAPRGRRAADGWARPAPRPRPPPRPARPAPCRPV